LQTLLQIFGCIGDQLDQHYDVVEMIQIVGGEKSLLPDDRANHPGADGCAAIRC